MADVDEVLERLAATGRRRTATRRAIIEALLDCGSHFTADEVASRVQRRFPSVNLSTVYRTLDVLEETGVVDHVHLGHGRAVFHLAEDAHQHLVCSRCERMEEVPVPKLRRLLQGIEREYGFQVDTRHFALVGLCSECRR